MGRLRSRAWNNIYILLGCYWTTESWGVLPSTQCKQQFPFGFSRCWSWKSQEQEELHSFWCEWPLFQKWDTSDRLMENIVWSFVLWFLYPLKNWSSIKNQVIVDKIKGNKIISPRRWKWEVDNELFFYFFRFILTYSFPSSTDSIPKWEKGHNPKHEPSILPINSWCETHQHFLSLLLSSRLPNIWLSVMTYVLTVPLF